MENPQANNLELVKSLERGANVTVSIDMIRHPEKNHVTGKLTEEGKKRFFEQLTTDLGKGEEYDTVKFYVSPLSRGQEAKEPIQEFLEVANINTAIRNKPELYGRFQEINGQSFKREMTAILEEKELLTKQQIEEIRLRDQTIAAYEPASKDFETSANELLISEFFDKNLPGAEFTGRDHAEVAKSLIDHFAKLAEKLKSGSKVKLVLVGHSGVIEYLTKYVYLQNHPELKSENVNINDIGGLVDFSEGPEITIHSDEKGEQKIKLTFKGLDLVYNK